MVTPVRSSSAPDAALRTAEALQTPAVRELMQTVVDTIANPNQANLRAFQDKLMTLDLSQLNELRGQPLAHTPPANYATLDPNRQSSALLAQGGATGTIGHSQTSLSGSGCAIASLGMIANQAGARRYGSIEQVNAELTARGGLEGSHLHWADAGRSVGLRYDSFVGFSDIDDALRSGDGHYVAAVDYKENEPGRGGAHGADHFVAVREYNEHDDVLVIADPAGNGREIAMTRGEDGAFYAESSRQGEPVTYRLIYMHRYERDPGIEMPDLPQRV